MMNNHPVQEKTTLWVHPLKNDNVGSAQQTLWVQTHRHSFRTHIVIFFNDEPIGSFSSVQGDNDLKTATPYFMLVTTRGQRSILCFTINPTRGLDHSNGTALRLLKTF